MKNGQERFIPVVDAWFSKLEKGQKDGLLTQLSAGGKAWQEWMQEHAPHSREPFLELDRYVMELMKRKSADKVKKELKAQGLQTVELLDSLITRATKELRYYYDAATLRDASLEEFERIVSNVIADFFIERRYSSWAKRNEYLGLSEERAARACYLIVANLIQTFYNRNVSLEVLETFMNVELEFTEQKSGRFADLIVRNKEALDRYFLFQRLSKLTKSQAAAAKKADE